MNVRTKFKEKSLAILENELDDIFSDFIRLRDADERGTVICFVTGEKVFYKDADAAHFQGRGNKQTRYLEDNVHACTRDSNRYDPNHQLQYRYAMIAKYGLKRTEEIEFRAKNDRTKFMRSDYEYMISHYKGEVAKLKREKGL